MNWKMRAGFDTDESISVSLHPIREQYFSKCPFLCASMKAAFNTSVLILPVSMATSPTMNKSKSVRSEKTVVSLLLAFNQ